MNTIVLATQNSGKLREFSSLFADLQKVNYRFLALSEWTNHEPAETGLTFVENALIKARHATTLTELPAIADDSGLIVDALGGAPGIYSARYAGRHHDFSANIDKVLSELMQVPEPKRTARFHCCLVYLRHANDACPIICEADWEGRILFEPRGDKGFGYDPIFYLPQAGCSVAELSADEKNQQSHRAQALLLLKNALNLNSAAKNFH